MVRKPFLGYGFFRVSRKWSRSAASSDVKAAALQATRDCLFNLKHELGLPPRGPQEVVMLEILREQGAKAFEVVAGPVERNEERFGSFAAAARTPLKSGSLPLQSLFALVP